MARPMVLMQENLLTEIYNKHAQGVPILKLIRNYSLDGVITAPTLTKLLKYMKAKDTTQDSNIHKLIQDSLFPQWLKEQEDKKILASCPQEYFYSGRMPLGVWCKHEAMEF